MALVQVNRNPSRRELALFGAIFLAFFAAVGWTVWTKTGSPPAAAGVWIVAAGVPAVGWAVPAFMRRVYLGMCYLTLPIGWVVSHLVLAVAYYAVLTPIGVLMRWFGRDPLRRRFEPEAKSYWTSRARDAGAERYFRQF